MKKELEMIFGGRGGSTYFDATKMQNHIDFKDIISICIIYDIIIRGLFLTKKR